MSDTYSFELQSSIASKYVEVYVMSRLNGKTLDWFESHFGPLMDNHFNGLMSDYRDEVQGLIDDQLVRLNLCASYSINVRVDDATMTIKARITFTDKSAAVAVKMCLDC